jgi:hypothetical protein
MAMAMAMAMVKVQNVSCTVCGRGVKPCNVGDKTCIPPPNLGLRSGATRIFTAPKIQNTPRKPRGNTMFTGYTPIDMQNIRNIAFHLKIISGRVPQPQPQPQPFHVVVIPEREIPPLCAAVVPINQWIH